MKKFTASIHDWIKGLFWDLKFRFINMLHPYNPVWPIDSEETATEDIAAKRTITIEQLERSISSLTDALTKVSEAARAASASFSSADIGLARVRLSCIIGEVVSEMSFSDLAVFVGKLPIPQDKKREVFGLPPFGDESIYVVQSEVIQRAMKDFAETEGT
jgi:hypothetical protein